MAQACVYPPVVLSPSASDKVGTGDAGTRASAVPLILGLAFVNTVVTS